MSEPFPLSAHGRALLAAATARILPGDDGPGSHEAGVAGYIERALADRCHRHFLPLMERGLEFLDQLAAEQLGQTFLACTPQQQDKVLTQVQHFPNNDARSFFQSLVDLTLEGFLCDPVHGGNRDGLGWRFIGFTPRPSAACAGETP